MTTGDRTTEVMGGAVREAAIPAEGIRAEAAAAVTAGPAEKAMKSGRKCTN